MANTTTEYTHQRIRRVALGDLLHRSARRFAERTVILDGDLRLSYAELDAAANRFANHLLGLGLAPGDRVAMLCANSMPMAIALFGIHKAGMTWVPINIALGIESIAFIIDHAEPRVMVVDAGRHDEPGLRDILRSKGVHAVLTGPMQDGGGATTLAAAMKAASADEPEVEISSDQLAFIMYTSGTTGKPKGVMHSHESVHSALMSNAIETACNTSGDVWSGMLPMSHVAGYANLLTCVLTGGAIVMQRGFDAAAMLEAIERHRISIVVGLPMMYAAMHGHPERQRRDLSSLRLCRYAMAPMPKTLLLELLDSFCPNFILQSGQTEVFPAATIFETHQQRQRFGSYWGVGTLVNEVAVMDDDGRLLGPGEVGEIVFRGPNVMLGYYKDAEATAAAQRHGWHHSGDLGRIDEDGLLMFMDRLKDIIKSGGENVPSVMVEEVLLRHPAVQNVAVVGLPHERWGEAITAFVTLKPGAQVSGTDLISHCKAHLGAFEVPKGVVFLPALPLSATGKIQKFDLRREHLQHYTGTPS